MKTLSAIAGGSVFALLAACSNQQAYEAVQQNRLEDCKYRPPGAEQECLRQYDKSYEEYERERTKVLKEGE